jgi:hypothetical protein
MRHSPERIEVSRSSFISKWLTPRQARVTIERLADSPRKGSPRPMMRTLLAPTTTAPVAVARPCALGGGYVWQFKSQVHAIPMANTTARRLRRLPT